MDQSGEGQPGGLMLSEEEAGTPRSKQSETPRDPSTYSKDEVRSLREDWSVRLMEGRLSQVDEESSGGRPVTEMPRAREFLLLERRKLAFDISTLGESTNESAGR